MKDGSSYGFHTNSSPVARKQPCGSPSSPQKLRRVTFSNGQRCRKRSWRTLGEATQIVTFTRVNGPHLPLAVPRNAKGGRQLNCGGIVGAVHARCNRRKENNSGLTVCARHSKASDCRSDTGRLLTLVRKMQRSRARLLRPVEKKLLRYLPPFMIESRKPIAVWLSASLG